MTGNQLSIPYAFPRAGKYRLWVQMKRAGHVVTGAFDVESSGLQSCQHFSMLAGLHSRSLSHCDCDCDSTEGCD